jgi:hypothetical protein
MLVFASMLENPAKKAGISVPPDPDNFEAEKEVFPHFFVFCAMQLGAPMPHASAHWENAKVIAAIPENELKTLSGDDIIGRGFQIGFSQP